MQLRKYLYKVNFCAKVKERYEAICRYLHITYHIFITKKEIKNIFHLELIFLKSPDMHLSFSDNVLVEGGMQNADIFATHTSAVYGLCSC